MSVWGRFSGERHLIRTIHQVGVEWIGMIIKLGSVFCLNHSLNNLHIWQTCSTNPIAHAVQNCPNESFSGELVKLESLLAHENIQTNFLLGTKTITLTVSL